METTRERIKSIRVHQSTIQRAQIYEQKKILSTDACLKRLASSGKAAITSRQSNDHKSSPGKRWKYEKTLQTIFFMHSIALQH